MWICNTTKSLFFFEKLMITHSLSFAKEDG